MSKINRRCVILIFLFLLLCIIIVLMIIFCPLQRQLPKAPQRQQTKAPQRKVTTTPERQLTTTPERQLTTTHERRLTKAPERQTTITPQIQLTTPCSPKYRYLNRMVDAFANIPMPVKHSSLCRWWCLKHTNCTGFNRFLNNDTCHYSTNPSEALSKTTSAVLYHRVTNRCPIV